MNNINTLVFGCSGLIGIELIKSIKKNESLFLSRKKPRNLSSKYWKKINLNSKHAYYAKPAKDTPRNSMPKIVAKEYLKDLGWTWIPTMFIGSGCKVHLRKDELPAGRLIVQVSRHLTAVIDGVLHDGYDCSREGTRCVYGYWKKLIRII